MSYSEKVNIIGIADAQGSSSMKRDEINFLYFFLPKTTINKKEITYYCREISKFFGYDTFYKEYFFRDGAWSYPYVEYWIETDKHPVERDEDTYEDAIIYIDDYENYKKERSSKVKEVTEAVKSQGMKIGDVIIHKSETYEITKVNRVWVETKEYKFKIGALTKKSDGVYELAA